MHYHWRNEFFILDWLDVIDDTPNQWLLLCRQAIYHPTHKRGTLSKIHWSCIDRYDLYISQERRQEIHHPRGKMRAKGKSPFITFTRIAVTRNFRTLNGLLHVFVTVKLWRSTHANCKSEATVAKILPHQTFHCYSNYAHPVNDHLAVYYYHAHKLTHHHRHHLSLWLSLVHFHCCCHRFRSPNH